MLLMHRQYWHIGMVNKFFSVCAREQVVQETVMPGNSYNHADVFPFHKIINAFNEIICFQETVLRVKAQQQLIHLFFFLFETVAQCGGFRLINMQHMQFGPENVKYIPYGFDGRSLFNIDEITRKYNFGYVFEFCAGWNDQHREAAFFYDVQGIAAYHDLF
jgi:hypothetical protein